MCILVVPNIHTLILEFLISNVNFEKAVLGLFLIYLTRHKIDSLNLTQKDEWSIKGLVVDLSILFL